MSTMVIQPMAFDLALPWKVDEEREKAFRSILKKVLIPLLVLFIVVPFLQLIKQEYHAANKAAIVTTIVLQPKPVEKPAVQQQPTPVAVTPAPLEKPSLKAQPKVESLPKAASKAAKTETSVDQKTSVAQAQGLTELSSQLKSLRGSLNMEKMQVKNVSDNVGGAVARSDRNVLGSENATRKSNGIAVNDSAMKGDVVSLAEHKATSVEGVGGSDMPSGTGDSLSHLSGQSGKRDMESIRRTLEETKSSVYILYQRALVDKPNLAGKFTFKIVIQPNGAISDLKLVSSELGETALEQDILARIRQINFGAKDVSPTVLEYKFVFLPS